MKVKTAWNSCLICFMDEIDKSNYQSVTFLQNLSTSYEIYIGTDVSKRL